MRTRNDAVVDAGSDHYIFDAGTKLKDLIELERIAGTKYAQLELRTNTPDHWHTLSIIIDGERRYTVRPGKMMPDYDVTMSTNLRYNREKFSPELDRRYHNIKLQYVYTSFVRYVRQLPTSAPEICQEPRRLSQVFSTLQKYHNIGLANFVDACVERLRDEVDAMERGLMLDPYVTLELTLDNGKLSLDIMEGPNKYYRIVILSEVEGEELSISDETYFVNETMRAIYNDHMSTQDHAKLYGGTPSYRETELA